MRFRRSAINQRVRRPRWTDVWPWGLGQIWILLHWVRKLDVGATCAQGCGAKRKGLCCRARCSFAWGRLLTQHPMAISKKTLRQIGWFLPLWVLALLFPIVGPLVMLPFPIAAMFAMLPYVTKRLNPLETLVLAGGGMFILFGLGFIVSCMLR